MPQPIPDAWRKDVIRILQTADRRLIDWTLPARQRWDADTFGEGWEAEAYDLMIAALQDSGVQGNETTSMPGQAGTYEFLFKYKSSPMYGKIALGKDRKRILILSAHRAERPNL
ncbi:MAG TPA: hypothetical protein VN578_14655 [Candidatus Binatia bacterium]|jgi:hypothetical protein|nr:hypothetical protein [Candidatus Binatia bacterium]